MQSTASGGVRGLSLRGSSLGAKVRKKTPLSSRGPRPPSTPTTTASESITSVDTLVKELRKSLHTMFATLDTNVATTNLYDNCSQQAFRFFTTTNTITPEAFHHKINKLGLHASARLCAELFHLVDQEDIGELTYATFAHRIFLPAGYFNFSKSICSSSPSPSTSPSSSRREDAPGETGGIQDILAKLRIKLAQHPSKETDRVRQAFRIFGKSSGITPSDFTAAMATLRLRLSARQVRELFALFDFDQSGDLDLNEFVQGVMLDDSTHHWFAIRDQQRSDEARGMRYSMAVQSVQKSWTIADIERMLREKIEQRTSKSSDCFRQAFRIFGKVNGIKPDEFHAALEAIGLTLDRSQADILFSRFDQNNSGDIDLDEFIHAVLPPDYTGRQWVAAADELHREAAQKKKQDAMTRPDLYMTEIEMETWSLDEIERRIRDKIQQATSKSSDTFRQAFKIFKKCNHVTMDDFRESLLALGFRLTPSQCAGLFRRYDTNNSNDIDLQEFCLRILPPDYTGDGDYWSHADKFHKHRQREKLAYVKRTKNGMLLLPKFDDARVRYTRGHYARFPVHNLESEPETCEHLERSPPPSRPESASTATVTESVSRPTSPRPTPMSLEPTSPRPPPTSPRSGVPSSPRPPMSPRVSRITSEAYECGSPRQPASPRPPSSHRAPLSPRHPQSSPSASPRRPTTPRVPSALSPSTTPGPAEGDVGLLDDRTEWADEADDVPSLRTPRSHHRPPTSARGDGISGSVSGDSTVSFASTTQRVVGGAKFTPTRTNALLLQRFMRVAAKRHQAAAAGGATTTQATATKPRPKRPHTTRL